MTKEQLVSRLRMLAAGHPSADCTFTAAAVEIEALQARVAELEYLDTQRLSSLRQVEAERNAAQGVIETITKDPTWFELKAERDALAAELAAALPYGPRPKFGAIGSRDVDVAEAQRVWDKAMAAQPAQVPAELSLNIIRKWPDGFQKRLDHVWKDVDGFIPNVKLYDLQRTLAEFGFTMKVYEQAAQPAQVPAGSIRLWDAQWVSIVNHDNAYNGWSTNDAVNHAVRMTERYIAANVAQNNLPPLPAAQEVKP